MILGRHPVLSSVKLSQRKSGYHAGKESAVKKRRRGRGEGIWRGEDLVEREEVRNG